MASLTRREKERCPSTGRPKHWTTEVPAHCKSIGLFSESAGYHYTDTDSCRSVERPSPEGAGSSGGDSHGRSDAPSAKSLKGQRTGSEDHLNDDRTGTYGPTMSENVSVQRIDRKVPCCEKCSTALVALKKQALSLAVHQQHPKDPDAVSAFLHDNLRVHTSRSAVESREGDRGVCGVCGTHLIQLKREAIHLALTREHAKWASQPSGETPTGSILTPATSGTAPNQTETKCGEKAVRETTANVPSFTNPQPHSRTQGPHSPQISRVPRTPHSPRTPRSPMTPQSPRRRPPKPPNPDMDRWVEEQQRLVASASKSTSMTSGNDVTVYSYHQAEDDQGEAGPVQTSPKITHISRIATMANSAAMSLWARAAQKLNLSGRKKALGFSPSGPPDQFSTCFRTIIQKSPPPAPPCLLQAAARTKDSPNMGKDKVKVVLRVCPSPPVDPTQPTILRVDPSKRRVFVVEPVSNSQLRSLQRPTLGGEGKALLKTYTFDAAYPCDSSQTEMCADILADVIRRALSGSDGCVLGLGCADAGPWSSMVGSDDSVQKLGLIPCAISWLYSAIERRKEKTWTEQTVSVSAVELCCGEEEEETLRDLLAEEEVPSSGSRRDRPAAQLDLREDPINGIQLRNLRVVKAQTAERAASLLDAAIASRRRGSQTGGRAGDIMPLSHRNSHMFFCLHVQHPRTDSSSAGKGPSRLTLIDLCNSMKGTSDKSDRRTKLPLSEEGHVILALLSGHKHIPNKGSKLALLLRQAMSSVSCHTTVVAQVSHLPTHLMETLATVQMASRIRRAQRRAKQSTSCSPCGRSRSRERSGGSHSLSLRAFHSSGEVGVDLPRLRLCGDLDDRSSSDQSCDTVIHINSDGSVRPDGVPTTLTRQPEFVPIIPSLPTGKVETTDDAEEFAALLRELLSIPRLREGEKKKDETFRKVEPRSDVETGQVGKDCLKCDTFAELQERLGCIDGSETDGKDVPKPPSKEPSANPVAIESQPRNDTGRQTDAESSETPQQTPLLLKREFSCSQISVGEKQTDGVSPGDSFQREDSGLYDCEEGSAASSSEDPPNQAFSLNTMCQAKASDLPNAESPVIPDDLCSQNCPAHAQIVPSSLPLSLQSDIRTSPAGKSSPISPALFSPASSASASPPSLATSVILGDILPKIPTEELREMKATITVTVQQPLDASGQDEIVFTMVEEVTISGALERGGTGGRIIHIRDTAQSLGKAQGSAGSQPIRIISNISEDSGATGCANTSVDPAAQAIATEGGTQKSLSQLRVEKRLLPSFINPMLIDANRDCDLEGAKPRGNTDENFARVEILSECRQNNLKHLKDEKAFEKDHNKRSDSMSLSHSSQICHDTPVFEDTAFQTDITEDKACERRNNNTDSSRPRGREPVYPSNTTKGTSGGEISGKITRNALGNCAASPGCLATMATALRTASLPRGWQNANHQESCWGGHVTDSNCRDPGGVTSSTPCSPGVTPERRQARRRSPANHSTSSWAKESLPFSPPRKYSMETRQGAGSPRRKDSGSLMETSSLSMKHDSLRGMLISPIEESSMLFSAKLEQLASRMYSQGKTPMEFQTLDRGGSTTSVSSKGSSKGSSQGSYEGNYKGNYEGGSNGYYESKGNFKRYYEEDSTLPRVSRSQRRNPRSAPMTDHSHHSTSSNNQPSQSPRSTRSKLSAVGKLKLTSPKVRRLSAPSTKNLSFSPKALRRSANRSASLSPDSKTPSPERPSCFHSSSPPQSCHFLSRSQSSPLSSVKSPIRGVISGRISDLLFLKGRGTSPAPAGPDKGTVRSPLVEDRLSGHLSSTSPHPLPSPYSRVTAPRTPSRLSEHASDATSVLSGELPPAMRKTSLLCPNRNSVVSSGYESMMRDSEATGSSTSNRDSVSDKSCSQISVALSSTSNRDSVSDKSCSQISVARSIRTGRRRGNTGSHQRRLSHIASLSLRRSASGPRAHRVDRDIPEAYEIKVYEIDDAEKIQRRGGAGKQGPACFSAKLKFLEHRQQRISEVRAKYNGLKRELEQAKQNLMLEPARWNQEFDLWQTFEVDSLEHLEALEVVTARLESRVNLCKANVMMVTSFHNVSTGRRPKRRRRTAPGRQQGFMGI